MVPGPRDILARREAGLAVALLLTVLAVTLVNPAFVSAASVRDILAGCAPYVIIACGVTLVVLTGEIDVSVGSLYGILAALLGVLASPQREGWSTPIAALSVLGAGTVIGLINGLLVGLARIPSIIVTLGMMAVLRGGAELLLSGQWIGELPSSLRAVGTGSLLSIPISVWAAASSALAAIILARRTRFGLRLHAVGGNPDAAAIAGIRAAPIKLAAYTITGALVALAAIISVPQLPKIESGLGVGWELFVISAVVVGGVSIRGGTGTVTGALLAALFLGIVRSALLFLKIGPQATYWETSIHGLFILAAVALDHITNPARAAPHESTDARPEHWRAASLRHTSMLAVLLLALFAYAHATTSGFVTVSTQLELLTQSSELALLAAPMALVILTGGVDLSVGSIIALAAITIGLTFERTGNTALACTLGVLAATLCGLVNGALITRLKMHPLIVTLATMALFRGLAEGISSARPVSGFPIALTNLASSTLGQIPVVLLPAVVAFALAWAALRVTVPGWQTRAIGFNETACRYAAVAVDRLKLALYTIAGACAGLAAVLLIIRRNTAKADAGLGIELDVITAVVLGGISVSGGRGSVAGVALGVLLLHELRQYIAWRWSHDEIIPLIIGAVLVLATVIGRLSARRR